MKILSNVDKKEQDKSSKNVSIYCLQEIFLSFVIYGGKSIVCLKKVNMCMKILTSFVLVLFHIR